MNPDQAQRRPISALKANHTTVVLTEDDIQNADAAHGYDLGFIVARCPHCEAHLYMSERGVVVCLNACFLSVGAYRRFQRELLDAGRKRPIRVEDNHLD